LADGIAVRVIDLEIVCRVDERIKLDLIDPPDLAIKMNTFIADTRASRAKW
jgi:hypothetical protein